MQSISSTFSQNSYTKCFFSEYQEKINNFVDYLAFGDQFSQINTIQKVNIELANAKRESLENHIKTLSNTQKCVLWLNLLSEKINFIRTIAMRFIHSATQTKAFNKVSDRYNNYKINSLRKDVERVEFYTDDHRQLEGALVFPTENKDKHKPVLIISIARNSRCEEFFLHAIKIAQKSDVNVFLYDSRGIGLSLGTERSTDNCAEDCKAAIKYALKNLCDNNPKKLGVLGYSWGGGVTAEALKKFKQEQDKETVQGGNKEIGLYINLRSFTALYHYTCTPLPGRFH